MLGQFKAGDPVRLKRNPLESGYVEHVYQERGLYLVHFPDFTTEICAPEELEAN